MNDSSILVIGDEDAVIGFALLGVEGRAVHSEEEARQALEAAMSNRQLRIVLLTEDWASAMRETVDQLKATVLEPVLLEIPASRPVAQLTSLRELVQQALGIRLER